MNRCRTGLAMAALSFLMQACGSTPEQPNEHAGHHMEQPHYFDYAKKLNNGEIKEDTMKGSVHRTAMANIGDAHVHMEYSSPGVKGRVIWGGLVAYNQVWVTGAHQATTLHSNVPLFMGGKEIAPATYAFFTIPGKEKWVVLLNKNFSQHLADEYDAKDDVLQMEVLPQENDKMVPRLTYTVRKTSETSGSIVMEWEKLKIEVPFSTASTKL